MDRHLQPQSAPDVWTLDRHREHTDQEHYGAASKQPNPARSSVASSDWRRKFPSTKWRREMDFNRYSRPLRRRQLPEDAPALYEDEIKASAAWLAGSQWTLTIPDNYPLTHELLLILDSLDDIVHSASDPDCAELIVETLRQARESIWSNQCRALDQLQDRHVALYVAGKVAETYIRLDAEDSMDRLMSFLDYTQAHIGVLPLACFHVLAAQAGILRRYDAVLKICAIAQLHHGGKADAELLHLRLRALIALSRDEDLKRYWHLFDEAGVPVPRKTFDLLLRTHVRRQNVEQLNEVLEVMPRYGHEVDAKAWLTILRGFQSFRPTLAVMLRQDAKIVQRPTLNVVNRLLVLLSKELDIHGALMVLRIFRIPSIHSAGKTAGVLTQANRSSIIHGPCPEPDVHTYAVLAHMFGRLGRCHEALDFFRLALCTIGDQQDLATDRALQKVSSDVMKAYLNAGHPVRAMWFASEVLGLPYFGNAERNSAPSIDLELPTLQPTRITATTIHYRTLLECASAIGSADSARRIVVHLLQHGHAIDRQVLRGLARLIFSTIDQDALEAIRVIRRLFPRGKYGRNEKRDQRLGSLVDLLQHLGASERVVLASQNSTDLHRRIDLGDSMWKAPCGSASPQSGSSSIATASKDELREWLITHSLFPFRGVSSTHEIQPDASTALIQDLSRPLSAAAYAMRIRVYASVRRDYESAQKVYHAMLSHDVKPNMMHIAPLIEGLTAVGRLDDAQRLKRNARETILLEPTLRIHTALIRGYVRAGDLDAARREIQELTRNGFKIDDTIANIIEAAHSGRSMFALVDRPISAKDSHSVATRFHALMRMRRYLAAQETLQTALDAGMRSDKVLHDLVRRSVSYVSKQHAKALALASATGDTQDAPAATGARLAKDAADANPHSEGERARANTRSDSHVFELAQALRLAQTNRERITKCMQRRSKAKLQQIKQHRKKVVSLVLDFADGKLHQQAGARLAST